MSASPKRVLLVEDDPSDVMLMEEALKESGASIEFQVARDGIEAMAYLGGQGAFAGAARPSLVLLDWRLPQKSGEEVLREIRGDPALKLLPVLVLTTSASEKDVRAAYSLGANAFITKPTGMDRLRELVSLIERFWLVCASLPVESERASIK
ncbi:MAG TPA: response regulator [Elusimicrobiota bacterium]|nr:response regulator [Elusimicrobiota bacterium]